MTVSSDTLITYWTLVGLRLGFDQVTILQEVNWDSWDDLVCCRFVSFTEVGDRARLHKMIYV